MQHNVSAAYTHATLVSLLSNMSTWSQATFGCDEEHGPIPPLKHLKKEIDEVLENINDRSEWADCFLLFFDAMRRNGITLLEILEWSKKKLEVCKTRQWPEPMKWTYDIVYTGADGYRCDANNGNALDSIRTYGSTPSEAKARAQEVIRTWDLEPHEHKREIPGSTDFLPNNHV